MSKTPHGDRRAGSSLHSEIAMLPLPHFRPQLTQLFCFSPHPRASMSAGLALPSHPKPFSACIIPLAYSSCKSRLWNHLFQEVFQDQPQVGSVPPPCFLGESSALTCDVTIESSHVRTLLDPAL